MSGEWDGWGKKRELKFANQWTNGSMDQWTNRPADQLEWSGRRFPSPGGYPGCHCGVNVTVLMPPFSFGGLDYPLPPPIFLAKESGGRLLLLKQHNPQHLTSILTLNSPSLLHSDLHPSTPLSDMPLAPKLCAETFFSRQTALPDKEGTWVHSNQLRQWQKQRQ
jgi:hypothetical protein